MSLIKRDRNQDLDRPFKNILDRFLGSEISDFVGDFRGTVPSVNIKETNDEIKIDVAAPGMKKDDFKVTLENDYLTISSENQEEHEEKDETYNQKEFSYQSFQRSFYLPENLVKADKIEAKYTYGILHLSVPKTEEAKKKEPKRIEIS
jgi:HSP20 family protein